LTKPKIVLILVTILVLASLPLQAQAIPKAAKKESPLLKGAYRIDQDGWIYVHLEGTPFQIGYQNGWFTYDNIDVAYKANIHIWWDDPETPYFGDWWPDARAISRIYIWPRLTGEMKAEIEGIAAGVKARGLKWDKWDILAFNAWGDISVYWDMYFNGPGHSSGRHGPPPRIHADDAGCSAFVATGSYTTDGEIVIGHNTWAGYADWAYCKVIIDLEPKKGYRIIYQTLGSCIWSGPDWIYNEAGLMLTETTLPDMYIYDPTGIPVFVRERYAMQYCSSIDDFIHVMTYRNNGAYANDWLIGDAKTGEICSLELGCHQWDIIRTFDGFITSCNYPRGPNVQLETTYDWTDPTTSGYCRTQRWKQIFDTHTDNQPGDPGKHDIDVAAGMAFESDHWDTYLSADHPSLRTLCGHGESETGPPWAFGSPWPDGGATDAKVTNSTAVLAEMGMWGRIGHPCGTLFDVETFLAAHPECAWEQPYLQDMPPEQWVPWSYFTKDMAP